MKRLAVPGMNCHSAAAPTFEYAARLNEDSTCGYENHADVLGAMNILARGHRELACRADRNHHADAAECDIAALICARRSRAPALTSSGAIGRMPGARPTAINSAINLPP